MLFDFIGNVIEKDQTKKDKRKHGYHKEKKIFLPIFKIQSTGYKECADSKTKADKHHDNASDPKMSGKKLEFKRKKGKNVKGNTKAKEHLHLFDTITFQYER